jgi:hypothetical protein
MKSSIASVGSTMCLVTAVAGPGCEHGAPVAGHGGTTTTSSSGDGGPPEYACSPPASCQAGHACLSLEDYTGEPLFSLRMSQLTFTSPMALTQGLVKAVVSGGVTPNIPSCNVNGPALFSWILQFNTSASTLQTGVAKPVADPTQGYTFVDEIMMQGGVPFHVHPVTFPDLVLAPDGSFSVGTGLDILIPIYLDATGTNAVIIPLRAMRMFAGRLSPDHDCIGSYDAEGLDPANGCIATDARPAFIDGASADGYVTLEDADTVVSTGVGMTLCVLLTGDGDGGTPVSKCKRMNGTIRAKGDWCSTTNAAATVGCADADRLAATFAASAIRLKN